MEKRQGALYFDREEERYNIRFGLEECYHGLYCGEGLEVLVGKRWVRTRIEKAADWYLVGIDTAGRAAGKGMSKLAICKCGW